MTSSLPARRRNGRMEVAPMAAQVRRVCRRVADGESVAEVCRDPLMPQRAKLYAWMAEEPVFAQMLEEARAAAERLNQPPPKGVHRYSAGLATEFLARIEDGRGLREVCAEPDMPSAKTVTRWLAADAVFARRYELARQAQADRLFDLAWRIACEATEETVKVARLRINTIKWRVGKLAPRRYGPTLQVAAAREEEERAEEARRPWGIRRFYIEDGKVKADPPMPPKP